MAADAVAVARWADAPQAVCKIARRQRRRDDDSANTIGNVEGKNASGSGAGAFLPSAPLTDAPTVVAETRTNLSVERRFYAADDWPAFAACHQLALALLPSHRLRVLLAAANHSPLAALHLPDAQLRSPEVGLTPKQITRLADARTVVLPDKLRIKAEDLAVWSVLFGDAVYPTNLSPLNDAPPLLFVRGTLHHDDKFSVAIVGSRRSTLYGREQAERFARAFAERGLTVVSGGAAGIDTFAHRATLHAGGRTLAVMGCGLDSVYPADNKALFAQIAAGPNTGALLSEFPLETFPEPWRFPTRNRIIAGIARLTVLVETPQDSGALITARNAAEYGRDVWAVPGPVNGKRSLGCHKLIQDGAGLADSPQDVLTALGLAPVDDGETLPFSPSPTVEAVTKTTAPPPVQTTAPPTPGKPHAQ